MTIITHTPRPAGLRASAEQRQAGEQAELVMRDALSAFSKAYEWGVIFGAHLPEHAPIAGVGPAVAADIDALIVADSTIAAIEVKSLVPGEYVVRRSQQPWPDAAASESWHRDAVYDPTYHDTLAHVSPHAYPSRPGRAVTTAMREVAQFLALRGIDVAIGRSLVLCVEQRPSTVSVTGELRRTNFLHPAGHVVTVPAPAIAVAHTAREAVAPIHNLNLPQKPADARIWEALTTQGELDHAA